MVGARFVALCIAVTAFSSEALALTSTQTIPFGPSTPNYDQTLAFNKFNPALGTLNSIKVEMQVGATGGSLTVDNDGPQAASVNVALGAEGNLSSVDVTLLDLAFQPVVANVLASTVGAYNLAANIGDVGGDYDGSAPDGAVMPGGSPSNSDNGFINSLFWSGYTGASGTYNIKAEIDQILDFGSIGGVEGAFSPVSASGSVTVTYDYTPIPEPGAIGLLGLGFAAVVMRLRKRG